MSYKVNDTAEVWKDINGFEGLYQVSNLGRVKSMARKVVFGYDSEYQTSEKILSPHTARGYKQVMLSQNGIRYYRQIHRLVAEAFIPNPNNYPIINHKNEIRDDNRVENLEWCTHTYNLAYNGNRAKKSKSRMRPILQYDLQGNLIAEYAGGVEAEKVTGISRKSISRAVTGSIKTSNGYIWRKK